MFENIFETVNSGFAQALYEDFLRDPGSVPPEWRALFDNGVRGERPAAPTTAQPDPDGGARPGPTAGASTAPPNAAPIKGPALRLLKNMEASLAVPTATSFRDIDVATLWHQRSHFNGQLKNKNIKLSFTHLIGWALILANKKFPSMTNAVIAVDGTPHQVTPDRTNMGLAVDVERKDGSRGLMVPVIKGADSMAFADFHTEYERLVAGARNGKLLPDAYQGATMTLTNPGTIGTVASVPRLMPGQGSIIATGAIRNVAGQRIMTVTSTYDHRIVQGAESGLFLQTVDKLLNGEEQFYETIAESMGIETGSREDGKSGGVSASTASAASSALPASTASAAPTASTDLYHVAAAMSLVKAHRMHGYLAAKLDPLGMDPVGDPALNPEPLGLTPEVMAKLPADVLRVYVPGTTLAEALPALQATYCGSIAYEIEHIARHDERVWLRRVIESGAHRGTLRPEDRRRLLSTLVRVEGLETFLHRSYLGHKRFGIEGLDVLVPMIHAAIDESAVGGAKEVVMGMAHRGRLNVLTHVIGVPYETLLAEFEGGREVEETLAPKGGTGDVKYHHGATGAYTTPDNETVDVTLMPNPSHLEAVNPVVEGYARAVQTERDRSIGAHDRNACLPILIHGDAAFAGQGIVAETINLSKLPGYETGGTLHIITNNQVGFTTNPNEGRSTDFASDLAKGFDVPIIHVNADDAEACLAAVHLAMMYRAKYQGDCVIDLVGYRRHGHNEGDEPRYTQPLMYQRIDSHPTVRELYAQTLVDQGILTASDVETELQTQNDLLTKIQQKLKEDVEREDVGEEPMRTAQHQVPEPPTALDEATLIDLNHQLLAVPDGFAMNPKLKRQLERRLKAFGDKPAIDWAHGEALAFGSLLLEGIPLRFSGQDSERGTFSQRHLVFHDANTGQKYAPLQNLTGAQASFELHNSPLSEYGVLGFEYGYSVRTPEALVLWEAQFGDFVNGAEIVIDQFIVAGLAKWGQTSRLVLLLPHGSEGQGPEHSSARLERFLALGAENNIRVANCSTPAQYFHLLRRQAILIDRRPLVIMTPKSLLRLPQAASSHQDFTEGGFSPVLDDPSLAVDPESVTRLVLCSGKVYYDLAFDARRGAAAHVAIGRIEMLYPFPRAYVSGLIERYPNLREFVWVQEEPSNFGARKWMVPKMAFLAPQGVAVRWITRPERSSPAEGYPAAHKAEQQRITAEAFALIP